MLNEPLWYWLIFLGAVLLIGAFPIAHKLEQRQDQRDRDLWEDTFGTRRPW